MKWGGVQMLFLLHPENMSYVGAPLPAATFTLVALFIVAALFYPGATVKSPFGGR